MVQLNTELWLIGEKMQDFGWDFLSTESFDMSASSFHVDYLPLVATLLESHDIPFDRYQLFLRQADSYSLYGALIYLSNHKILDQNNYEKLLEWDAPSFHSILNHLVQQSMLNQESFNLIKDCCNHPSLSLATTTLSAYGILNHETFALVAGEMQPNQLAQGFTILATNQILTPENQKLLFNHPNCEYLATILSLLASVGIILTPETKEQLATNPHCFSLKRAFEVLHRSEILTQANVMRLLEGGHAPLIDIRGELAVWNRMQDEQLPQALFEQLLLAAGHENPSQEFRRVIDAFYAPEVHLAPAVGAGAGAGVFNGAQSTHTASVHRSVSESATKLKSSYAHHFDLDAKIAEIKVFVNHLPPSLKNDAARRCMELITAPDYSFLDVASDVSTKQLLAMAYVAIHDVEKCRGIDGTPVQLDDARARFIDGLYEIQRGYNLDDDGQDNGLEDSHICTGGTFNKIMEKLNGIHQDVEVYYITHAGAVAKFPKLVQEHALRYLTSIASPETAQDYQAVKALIETLTADDNLGLIWAHIRTPVETALWEEFREAYGDNASDERFLNLLNFGNHIDAFDFTAIHEKLHESTGYQAYRIQQHALSLNSLWAQRGTSAEKQQDFDREYGLTISPKKA